MGRAPCCEKVGLKKGRWAAEEDERLINYIAAHGEGSWRSLPKNAGLLRCGKSCRLRWVNYLRSDLKRGNITKEEEETILKLHASLGNRWSAIVRHLPGRTDNEIKNYWNSHLSQKARSFSPTDNDANLSKVANKQKGERSDRKNEKLEQQSTDESKTAQSEQGESMVIDSDHTGVNSGLGQPMSPTEESGAHKVNGEGGSVGVTGGDGKRMATSDGIDDEWGDWDFEGFDRKIWDEMWPLGLERDQSEYQLEGSSFPL